MGEILMIIQHLTLHNPNPTSHLHLHNLHLHLHHLHSEGNPELEILLENGGKSDNPLQQFLKSLLTLNLNLKVQPPAESEDELDMFKESAECVEV